MQWNVKASTAMAKKHWINASFSIKTRLFLESLCWKTLNLEESVWLNISTAIKFDCCVSHSAAGKFSRAVDDLWKMPILTPLYWFSFTARDTACVIQMWCSSFTTLTPFSSWPLPWSSSTPTCTRPTLNPSVKWDSTTSFATWEVCALFIHLRTSPRCVGWYSWCDHSKNK